MQSCTGAPLPVPIHAFGGRYDDIGIAGMDAWRRETTARYTLDWFDGGHFFVREREETMLAYWCIVWCKVFLARRMLSLPWRERMNAGK
ncbi:MAG TPA: hypothetical protein VI140_12660 [Oxalicibacterium sp.]